MSRKLDTSPAVIGIDVGKHSFHIVGLRQKWLRGQVEVQLANLAPILHRPLILSQDSGGHW
jgi:hypothetical protein